MHLSNRVESLSPSSTIAVTNRAKQLKAEGVDVLSFAAGEPDFDTPPKIRRAAAEALESGYTRYMPTPGDPAARQTIAEKLTRENGIPDCTHDHVVISTGGKQSLYLLFQCLLDPPASGQQAPEVLIPTPAWVSYAPQARLAGGAVKPIDTSPENDFRMTPAALEAAITPNARILVLNSPSNPCGTMYSPEEVDALARVVADAAASTAPGLVVIADEIYEKIIYGGVDHRSIGANAAIAERCVTVNGLSKAYAMTGWRVGYAAGAGDFGLQIAKAMAKLQGQMTTNITAFCYPAIVTALTECADDVERMRKAFAARADLIYNRIVEIPGFNCPRPTGAFYVFPDISAHFGKTSAGGAKIESPADFAAALLDENHVAVVPGEDFMGCGDRCVRLSFACSEEQIEQGMTRLGEFVSGIS